MDNTSNVIAQTVLMQLSALGRSPTPENYADLYSQLAGEPNPFASRAADAPAQETGVPGAEVSPLCRELLDMVQQSVNGAMLATEQLSQNLDERSDELSRNVVNLQAARQHEDVLKLLTLIVAQASGIQQTIDSDRKELQKTRLSLISMRKELNDTRKQLNEDALTGALNRRGMDQTLLREIARAQRNSTALTLAMLDIDHFKQINDSYGHEVGDQALVHFIALTRSILRKTDAVVRYGGEEFILILPETDAHGAGLVLERLRGVVAKSPLRSRDKTIAVTFSAGLAQYGDDENGHALLHRADKALFAAKQAGRDCYKVAD